MGAYKVQVPRGNHISTTANIPDPGAIHPRIWRPRVSLWPNQRTKHKDRDGAEEGPGDHIGKQIPELRVSLGGAGY